MSNRTQIKVYGKTYNLKNSSNVSDLQDLAAFVDAKMKELAQAKAGFSSVDLAVLAALNIAQELLELKKETTAGRAEAEKSTERLIKMLTEEIKNLESASI